MTEGNKVSQVYIVSTPNGYNSPRVGLLQCVSIFWEVKFSLKTYLQTPECWLNVGSENAMGHSASVTSHPVYQSPGPDIMLVRVFW